MARPRRRADRTPRDRADATWPAHPEPEQRGLSEAAAPFLHRPARPVVIPLRRPGKIGGLCEKHPRAFEVSMKRDWKRLYAGGVD